MAEQLTWIYFLKHTSVHNIFAWEKYLEGYIWYVYSGVYLCMVGFEIVFLKYVYQNILASLLCVCLVSKSSLQSEIRE